MDKEDIKVTLECALENLVALQVLAHYEEHHIIDYYKALEPVVALIEEVLKEL